MKFYISPPQQIVVGLFLSLGVVTNAGYTALATIDRSNIVQTTVTAIENIAQTAATEANLAVNGNIYAQQTLEYAQQILQYQKQLEQFQQQIKDYENMSGNYNMGQLLDSASDTATRRWAPASWQETLTLLKNGGNPATSQYLEAAVNTFKTQQNMRYSNSFGHDSQFGVRHNNYYDSNVSTNLTAMSLADVAFSTTNERTQNIEGLNDQIDQAHDQKGALDLTNRLLVQVLHQQNQLIQLLAVQTGTVANHNYGSANTAASESEFNTFDEKI